MEEDKQRAVKPRASHVHGGVKPRASHVYGGVKTAPPAAVVPFLLLTPTPPAPLPLSSSARGHLAPPASAVPRLVATGRVQLVALSA